MRAQHLQVLLGDRWLGLWCWTRWQSVGELSACHGSELWGGDRRGREARASGRVLFSNVDGMDGLRSTYVLTGLWSTNKQMDGMGRVGMRWDGQGRRNWPRAWAGLRTRDRRTDPGGARDQNCGRAPFYLP